ncbi:hypothetical protein CGRA01v4_11715 [Colletotrichum graminicola]|nr:hypothetical protein CGRA01v4_11715 [Colletotrichum graminicola]
MGATSFLLLFSLLFSLHSRAASSRHDQHAAPCPPRSIWTSGGCVNRQVGMVCTFSASPVMPSFLVFLSPFRQYH